MESHDINTECYSPTLETQCTHTQSESREREIEREKGHQVLQLRIHRAIHRAIHHTHSRLKQKSFEETNCSGTEEGKMQPHGHCETLAKTTTQNKNGQSKSSTRH